jgi:hypothetical protein
MGLGINAKWLVLAAGLLAGAAQAEVLTFEFRGTVTDSVISVPVGSAVVGTFSYDSGVPSDEYVHRPGAYAFYEIPAPGGLSAQVGDLVISTTRLHVTVYNNQGGNVEDMVEVTSSPPTVNGVTYPEGHFGFNLASGPGSTNVLHDESLPRSFNIADFNAWTYGFLQMDGGPSGQLLNFNVDSIRLVDAGDSHHGHGKGHDKGKGKGHDKAKGKGSPGQ